VWLLWSATGDVAARLFFSGLWCVLGVHLSPDVLVFGLGFPYKLDHSGRLWPFLLMNEHNSSPAVIPKKNGVHKNKDCQLFSSNN
jgi:hypothetical protein